jgi:hypothetical protein
MYTRILQASFAVFLLSIPTNLQKQVLTWLQPILDQYFGGCMISMNNISNGSKKPTRRYKTYDQSIFYIFWVIQGERIFVYQSYYLGQCHSKQY